MIPIWYPNRIHVQYMYYVHTYIVNQGIVEPVINIKRRDS